MSTAVPRRSITHVTPAGRRHLDLTFNWYLAHLNNATSADFFRVSVVNSGGTATQVFNQAGAANPLGRSLPQP